MGADEELGGEMAELEVRLLALRPLVQQKRRPFFVEFAGTPKAGKTSTLNAINRLFNRNGLNSVVFQERASVSPLSTKGSTNFNVWVTCATLLGMLEALENDKLDVIILDRGLFDGLAWNDWQEQTLRMGKEEAESFRSFVLLPRWRDLIDAVVVMHCNPDSALEREHANQVTVKPGSVMNADTLRQLRDQVLDAVESYRDDFRNMLVFDTTGGVEGVARSNMNIAKKLVALFGDFLDEEVLCVPTPEVAQFIPTQGEVLSPEWATFRAIINRTGTYVRRTLAEDTDELTQIIPVCIIEFEGKYLTNLRHEPNESLHGTLSNWAGGHVRRQDLGPGQAVWDSVMKGLRREIAEELALVELPQPSEVGVVHTTEDRRAARHLGVVFLVHIKDSYTAKMVGFKTLREGPLKSVQTAWRSIEEMQAATEQRDWSIAIGRHLAAAQRA